MSLESIDTGALGAGITSDNGGGVLLSLSSARTVSAATITEEIRRARCARQTARRKSGASTATFAAACL